MGPVGHQRIAQRYNVVTTPILWRVPKRRGLNARSKSSLQEAAVVELSIMGAAIVAPLRWRAVVGSKVEVRWENQVGLVTIRREATFPGSTTLALYGVEFSENASPLASALFDRLVMEPAAAAHQPEPETYREPEPEQAQSGPSVWAAPNAWTPGAEAR